MPGPFDPLADLAHTYAAEDYMAQRKRLREARARWIEEHECPKPMTIEHTDEDGKVIGTSAVGFFEVGKRKYEGDYPEAFKPSFKPEPETPTAAADLDELDEIIAETGAFLAPGIYRESAHPEIQEGEDYGQYCARIGREYEQATGASAVRRPVPDSDGVRDSAAADPGGERGVSAPGASDRERVGESVCGDPDADHAGGAEPGDAAGGAGKPSDNAEWYPHLAGDADPDRNPAG